MGEFMRHMLMLVGLMVVGMIGLVEVDRALFPILHMPQDDTDSYGNRSGLGLRRDHGTGCQYLESRFGGLTPRLGADGRQICEGRN